MFCKFNWTFPVWSELKYICHTRKHSSDRREGVAGWASRGVCFTGRGVCFLDGAVLNRGCALPMEGGGFVLPKGRVLGGVPASGAVPARGHVPARGVPAGEVCVSQHALRQTPPVNKMTDRRLWKYYLAVTSLRTVIRQRQKWLPIWPYITNHY